VLNRDSLFEKSYMWNIRACIESRDLVVFRLSLFCFLWILYEKPSRTDLLVGNQLINRDLIGNFSHRAGDCDIPIRCGGSTVECLCPPGRHRHSPSAIQHSPGISFSAGGINMQSMICCWAAICCTRLGELKFTCKYWNAGHVPRGLERFLGVARTKDMTKYLQFINVVLASVIEIGFVKSNRIIIWALSVWLVEYSVCWANWELQFTLE